MDNFKKILVYQTAFLGDIILTFPLIQSLKKKYPNAEIDFVTTPTGNEIAKTHSDINKIIIFNKRNIDKGWIGLFKFANKLKTENYDIVFSPHRSFRTSILLFFSRIPIRISFDKSSLNFLYTKLIKYENGIHEIERNLSLMSEFINNKLIPESPIIIVGQNQKEKVSKYFIENNVGSKLISIAPGSVWKTKIWPLEYFEKLISIINLNHPAFEYLLIGGNEDVINALKLKENLQNCKIHQTAGKFSFIESAELISRSKLLITNDSAPLHLGSAMKTPTVAIFGATVPEFGFGPFGNENVIIENKKLSCRPCAVHGGEKCPIETFECMFSLKPELVYSKIEKLLK